MRHCLTYFLLVCVTVTAPACGETASETTSAVTGTQREGDTLEGDASQEVAPLTIGINPTGIEDPAQFKPLNPGDELTIEFGFQGLWMVVLALRSETPVQGLATLYARVETASEVIGEFTVPKQLIFEADDGNHYYLNLFLVVSGPEYAGEMASVLLEVSQDDIPLMRDVVEVRLTGGDIPYAQDATPPSLFPDTNEDSDAKGPEPQDASSDSSDNRHADSDADDDADGDAMPPRG